MAKLTLLIALAFTALLVAFATAHTTIITAAVEDDNPFPPQIPICRQQLQMQRLDQCQMYLEQGIQTPYELNHGQSQQTGDQQLQQQCCQQLQNVDRQCQCEAVRQVVETARQIIQGQQQQGRLQFGSHHQQQLEQRLEQTAQNLPQQCRLQIRQEECQIRRGGSSDSQQCSRIQGQRFNQCQRFIQEAQSSGSPRMMMSRQSQQQLRQCCNELENVQRDCQCEALEELQRQAIQQQQQGESQQQHHQGGQQQRQPWKQQQGSQRQIEQAMETIRNQCNLQVQQCRIPSAMF